MTDSALEAMSRAVSDKRRLDWLEADPDRLEDVCGFVNNEGETVRGAIDRLMVWRDEMPPPPPPVREVLRGRVARVAPLLPAPPIGLDLDEEEH